MICVFPILLFNTTEPFTDTISLLFFPSLLHSIDEGTLAVADDLDDLELLLLSIQNEANAFSLYDAGAHQGASKVP